MDQTPYDPHDSPKRTYTKKGSKTVNSKEIKTSVGRVTVCLAVCADGYKLPPMVVYKGQPDKHIMRETRQYPKDALYQVQKNAWCDERCMLFWVDNVLKPFVEKVPPGVVPYLLLDKYKCHYQGSVAKAIEALGVEWDIIPGGCTGLVQPIDVGIGKPFKHRIRYWLEEWLADQDTSRVKTQDVRKMIAEWVVASWARTKEETVHNSWRHTPFSYFPEEPTIHTEYESEYDYSSEEDSEDNEDEIIEPI